MLLLIVIAATVLAGSESAVVPVDSTSVSVKQSGQDYSYSIHENRGVALDASPVVQHLVPVVGARSQHLVHAPGVVAGVVGGHAAAAAVVKQQQVRPRTSVVSLSGVQHEVGAYAVPIGGLDYVPQGYQYALTYPHGVVPYPYSAAAVVSAV